jgi:hypothetical protein
MFKMYVSIRPTTSLPGARTRIALQETNSMEPSNQEKMFALLEQKQPDQSVRQFCKAQGISEAIYLGAI